LLGSAAIAPIVGGAAAALLAQGALRSSLLHLTLVWSSAVLCFLAGVRRGLSFATPGGATAGEIASALFLFALGLPALFLPAPTVPLVLLIVGYASTGLLDARAARRGAARRRGSSQRSARCRPHSPLPGSVRC
jgi:hypothetical protein